MSWEAIGAIGTVAAIFITILLWALDRRHKHASPASVASKSRGLRVSTSFGFHTFENPPRLGEHQMLIITIANPNPRPYQVDSVGLSIEGTSLQLVQPNIESDRGIPTVLRETDKVMCWIPIKHIAHALVNSGISRPVRLRAYAGDSYNDRHLGEWTDFDPQGVLRGES